MCLAHVGVNDFIDREVQNRDGASWDRRNTNNRVEDRGLDRRLGRSFGDNRNQLLVGQIVAGRLVVDRIHPVD